MTYYRGKSDLPGHCVRLQSSDPPQSDAASAETYRPRASHGVVYPSPPKPKNKLFCFFLRRNLAAKGISRSCFILVPQNLKKKKRKASEGVGLPSPPCIQENTFYIREHILRKASDGVGLPSPPATCPKFCKVSALVHLPYTSVSKET